MNEPKLRFKADDGSQFPDWEEKKIGDIFSKVKDKNKDGQNQNVITNSAEFGLINQRDFFDKDIAVDGKTENYTVIKTGDFVYNPRKSKQAPYGPFNCYQLEEDGIVSPLYTCLRPKGNADDKYLHWYFQSGSWYRFIYENGAQNGARHDRVGMTDSLMQGIPVYLPQVVEEQQKIAEFLSTIDTVIEKQKETVSAWEERKKGVMQKLFNQEVRFKADDGSEFPEWEEKKLSEMFKKVIEKNRLDLPPLTIVQGYGTIRRDESERRIAYDEKGLKNYKAVQKDDFIVHLRSFEGGLEIANQDGIVSPAYHVYRGNDEVHPSFYYPYFRSSSFIKGKLSICVTGVRDGKNIEMGSFDELLIPHPCLAEQQKIADCLSSFDEVIEKQKATLAAWEELKKGLLQQMFV